jgi:hypothetical protein
MTQKLPLQLQQFFARIDRGLLATLVLCLFALYPLLRPGLPNGTDVLYHVYRVAEMDRAWSHGVLMPRWAESFYYGYGSPVFHYYASFTYYITSVLMRLFALDSLNALRALIALCVMVGGAGMYLFARDMWRSKLAGVLAALCFVYAPYMIFTEPYARGAYPEYLALSIFPLVMWRFQRLLMSGCVWDVLWAALGTGLLIITHNLTAISGFGVILAWLIWQLITRSADWRHVRLAGIAALLGVGLAAFFWIPVILERGDAKFENLIAVSQLDFRNFFVPLSHLFAFTPRPDEGALNGLLHQLNMGVAQWALALAGVVGMGIIHLTAKTQRTPREEGNVGVWHAAPLRGMSFFALASLALIFIISPLSTWLWDTFNVLAYFQFPWRFLGPLAFMLAALAGINALWIERLPTKIAGGVTTIAVLLPLALALPTMYVTEWVHPTIDTSTAAYQQAEVSGLQLGTTFSNEYLPRQVYVLADPSPRLLADYADGYPVNRANLEALPAGASVELVEHAPQNDTWTVSSETPFTMEVLTFYFPGWRVFVDDVEIPITPSDQHGFITFPIEVGTHTVRLFLGSTPARGIGGWVTLGAVGILAVMLWRSRKSIPVNPRWAGRSLNNGNQFIWGGVGAAGALMIVLVLIFMREGGAWVDSPAGEVVIAQHPLDFRLGEHAYLIGYDLNGTTFRAGDRVELVLYWYADEPAPYKYQPFIHIGTVGVPPLAQAPGQDHPGGRPMTEWTADRYVRAPHVIFLPANMPAGEYQIIVGLYTCETRPAGECGNGERPIVYDAAGNEVGDVAVVATIVVRP